MPAYTFHAAGAYSSLAAGGGNMTPAMPAFSAGELGLLESGVNSTSISPPTISGWTVLTPQVNVLGAALYGRILQAGDTSPTFQWDASHQAFSRILSFGGDVYTDLATIVAISNDRATSTVGRVAVGSTSAPAAANGLVIRAGRCVKTATNNGSQLVQNGTALAAALWYWQQTTATATSADQAPLTNADTSNNSQGYTVVLKSSSIAIPYPPTSLGGMNVQVCM